MDFNILTPDLDHIMVISRNSIPGMGKVNTKLLIVLTNQNSADVQATVDVTGHLSEGDQLINLLYPVEPTLKPTTAMPQDIIKVTKGTNGNLEVSVGILKGDNPKIYQIYTPPPPPSSGSSSSASK